MSLKAWRLVYDLDLTVNRGFMVTESGIVVIAKSDSSRRSSTIWTDLRGRRCQRLLLPTRAESVTDASCVGNAK